MDLSVINDLWHIVLYFTTKLIMVEVDVMTVIIHNIYGLLALEIYDYITDMQW